MSHILLMNGWSALVTRLTRHWWTCHTRISSHS